MATGLTLSEVAERAGVTERTIKRRMAEGRHPAPSLFTSTGPRWTIADLDAEPLAPRKGRVTTREDHMRHLLDEVRYWAYITDGAPIRQNEVGRVVNGRPFPLGTRVSALRGIYRAKHDSGGRDFTIPPQIVAQFEAVPGWAWNAQLAAWTERFEEVKERFIAGALTDEDAAWLRMQERRFKVLKGDAKELLDSVPGLRDVGKTTKANPSRVPEFVAACNQWLRENPDHLSVFSMPFKAVVRLPGQPDLYPVGRRATYYRRRYIGLEGRQPLSQDEVTAIEAIPGWTWERSPSHVENGQRWARRNSARAR